MPKQLRDIRMSRSCNFGTFLSCTILITSRSAEVIICHVCITWPSVNRVNFHAIASFFCILKDFRSEQWGTNKHTCVYLEHIWQLFISPSYIIFITWPILPRIPQLSPSLPGFPQSRSPNKFVHQGSNTSLKKWQSVCNKMRAMWRIKETTTRQSSHRYLQSLRFPP